MIKKAADMGDPESQANYGLMLNSREDYAAANSYLKI
jgi:hypothetical protein